MGNHEAYGTDIQRTLEKAKAAAAGTNVHVLENETVRIDNVTFAGATLWTDFAIKGDAHRAMMIAADRMNDYKKIRIAAYRRRFLPHHALTRHLKSRAFLKAEIRKPRGDGKLAVVTHHAPVPEMSHESGRLGTDDGLYPAHRSDLRSLMWPIPDDERGALRPPDLWIYGHTHESFDAVIGATLVVSECKRLRTVAATAACLRQFAFRSLFCDRNLTLAEGLASSTIVIDCHGCSRSNPCH